MLRGGRLRQDLSKNSGLGWRKGVDGTRAWSRRLYTVTTDAMVQIDLALPKFASLIESARRIILSNRTAEHNHTDLATGAFIEHVGKENTHRRENAARRTRGARADDGTNCLRGWIRWIRSLFDLVGREIPEKSKKPFSIR